jgi:predicted Holliday junction resolvase-like endonuclease
VKQDTIAELQADRRIMAECPDSGEVFPLADAVMFYVGDPIPAKARKVIDELEAGLEERREDLREARRKLKERSETATVSVNIGKILEKVAPAMNGFGMDCRDLRPLFEPIDYVAFNGLASGDGRIDSILFFDVKTGGAQLTQVQRQIKDAVERGKVHWDTYGGKL